MKFVCKQLKKQALACATLVSTAIFSANILAQEAAVDIPTSFHGTYALTYANAQTGSPLSNGTSVVVVLAPGNLMCVAGYTLTKPVTKNGNPAEAYWTEATAGISLAVSNIAGNFNEINVGSTSGTWWGQLQGSKTSSVTSGCQAAESPTTDPAKVAELFEEAQKKLAQYFPAGDAATTQTLDGYTYRYYPSTQIYLAINNGEVYVMGGSFGNEPLKQGALDMIIAELDKMTVSVPDTEIPKGNSTLVITGKIGALGVLTDLPATTIENLPMPGENDVDGVRNAVLEQYKDAGITGDITVTLISSSSNSIVFNIKFSGATTTAGFTVAQTYDVIYTYTKN